MHFGEISPNQVWQTGYMHNRVRMITGSFLVKNLLQHWHHGERWFWDTLVDALERLNGSEVHAPWEAPAAVQSGLDYPEPIVELKAPLARAFAAFNSMSGEAGR